jgi:predicted nucleotidyltransferase
LTSFARELQRRYGAERVLLFGSQARGNAQDDSDFDFIIVSPRFAGLPSRERGRGLNELFYEVGGYAPLDLICLTPNEFDQARQMITLVAAVLPEAIDLLQDLDD